MQILEIGYYSHSARKLEIFGNDFTEKYIKVSVGAQSIVDLGGYFIHIEVTKRLTYLKVLPYTNSDW